MFDKFVIHVEDRTQGLNRIALVNDKPIGMEIYVQFHALHTFFFFFTNLSTMSNASNICEFDSRIDGKRISDIIHLTNTCLCLRAIVVNLSGSVFLF